MVAVTSNAPGSAIAPKIPTDAKELPGWCRDFSEFVVRQFRIRPIRDTAVNQIFMFSPDGATWKITISNTGVLTTVKEKDA